MILEGTRYHTLSTNHTLQVIIRSLHISEYATTDSRSTQHSKPIVRRNSCTTPFRQTNSYAFQDTVWNSRMKPSIYQDVCLSKPNHSISKSLKRNPNFGEETIVEVGHISFQVISRTDRPLYRSHSSRRKLVTITLLCKSILYCNKTSVYWIF